VRASIYENTPRSVVKAVLCKNAQKISNWFASTTGFPVTGDLEGRNRRDTLIRQAIQQQPMTQTNIQHAPGMNTLRPLDANLWQSQLDEAIRSSNDAQMWDLVRQQGDQEEAHEIVATRLSRLAFRIDNKSRYSELFLMPLIDHAGCVVDNADAWKRASHPIGEALDQWLPAKSSKIIFNGVRPFDWVGTWQSKIIRSHLHRAVPGYEQVRLTTVAEKILLPENAPRLGFVSMVLTSQLGWLSMGQATTCEISDFAMLYVSRFKVRMTRRLAPCSLLIAFSSLSRMVFAFGSTSFTRWSPSPAGWSAWYRRPPMS
jgi:hypothetical protein